jgi:hypothetical protein
MISNSTDWPAVTRQSTTIATKGFAHYIRHRGCRLLLSVRHAYDAHQEKAQMRLAPTKPRSWQDVRRAGVDRG